MNSSCFLFSLVFFCYCFFVVICVFCAVRGHSSLQLFLAAHFWLPLLWVVFVGRVYIYTYKLSSVWSVGSGLIYFGCFTLCNTSFICVYGLDFLFFFFVLPILYILKRL